MGRTRRLHQGLIGFGAVLALTLGAGSVQASDDPNGALSKDERKCVVEINKSVAKVAKAQGKRISKCIKSGAKDDLAPGQTIEDCVANPADAKVDKATIKLLEKLAKKCEGQAPGFGVPATGIDPNALNAAALASGSTLIHTILGTDLDSVILPAKDANDPVVKPSSKCQIDVTKAAKKCFDTRWKVFNKCKKNGLKGKSPPGAIDSADDLETLCLQDPNEDTGQPDPKGKIEKACETKLQAKIDKKCGSGSGADRVRAFPEVDPNADLRAFVDGHVECEFCRLVNTTDGLARDCDLFDDGLSNLSCATCIPLQEVVSQLQSFEGCVPSGSQALVGADVDYCEAGVCSDGFTAGCAVSAQTSAVSVNLLAGMASLQADLDDFSVDFDVSILSVTIASCDLDVTNASAGVSVGLSAVPDGMGGAVVESIDSVSVSSTQSLAVSGCSLGGLLSSILGFFEPFIVTQIELIAAQQVEALLETAILGQLICL